MVNNWNESVLGTKSRIGIFEELGILIAMLSSAHRLRLVQFYLEYEC